MRSDVIWKVGDEIYEQRWSEIRDLKQKYLEERGPIILHPDDMTNRSLTVADLPVVLTDRLTAY